MTKKTMIFSKLFLIATILLFTVSCTDENNITDLQQEKVNLVVNKQKYDVANNTRKDGNGDAISDSFTINSSGRVGDILEVSVTYSGGCEEHTFDVIWDGVILLSHPCKIGLLITHDSHGDKCEAELTEVLEVDLKTLIGVNEYKDICTYDVYSLLNESDNPDSIVTNGD